MIYLIVAFDDLLCWDNGVGSRRWWIVILPKLTFIRYLYQTVRRGSIFVISGGAILNSRKPLRPGFESNKVIVSRNIDIALWDSRGITPIDQMKWVKNYLINIIIFHVCGKTVSPVLSHVFFVNTLIIHFLTSQMSIYMVYSQEIMKDDRSVQALIKKIVSLSNDVKSVGKESKEKKQSIWYSISSLFSNPLYYFYE